jgi:hypothetical protein
MKETIYLTPTSRAYAIECLKRRPDGDVLTLSPPTRSNDQNALLWALLTDVSNQVEWYGRKLTPAEWKDFFSASLQKMTVVPNMEGTGFIALGQSTSRMTKRMFSDLCELIQAFGSERGVRWTAPASYEEFAA